MKEIIIKCPNKDCGATMRMQENESRTRVCPVCHEEQLFKITTIDPVLGHKPMKKYYRPKSI